MKKLLLTALIACSMATASSSQTTLNLINNTSNTIYAAYAIYDATDGWTTHGWFRVEAYDERELDLDDYNGAVYIHGHAGSKYWGNDVTLCTGGQTAFTVINADKIRCEYSRPFTRTSVAQGATKRWVFNP